MSHKKPTPVIAQLNNRICPVCGKRSYSSAGIHPQCAVHQADLPRQNRLKAEKKLRTHQLKQRAWDKKCPKCGAQIHVRRRVCDCGHDFFGK